MPKPNILNKNEAAKIAGVDPKTIYEWVNKGYLRKRWVKGRKTFKIDQYELEEYIKNRDIIKDKLIRRF